MNLAAPSPTLPHIVLIIMDTVGAKRCSAYGHRRDTTPGLTRIAGEGVLYKHCFAPAAWTIPSHVSLLSGLYPGQHGCNSIDFVFPGNYYVLPEILQRLGYYTIGISSNYIISRNSNFHYGFDEFYEMDTLFNSDRYFEMRRSIKSSKEAVKNDLEELILIIQSSFKDHYYSYPLKHLLDRIYRKLWGDLIKKSYYATERSFSLARKLIQKYRDRPLFLFFNFMEAHQKYNPPKRFNNILRLQQPGDSLPELLHEQAIAYLDHRLFSFYSFLDKIGLKDHTLFIVTSDHGEAFGEHGFWGHIQCIYNELVHIPLVTKYPASFGLTGESGNLVQLHDLFATLMEVVEAPVPLPESSRSLLGPGRDFALIENLDPSFGMDKIRPGTPSVQPCTAIIDAELNKLIRWMDGRLELYDLKTDYRETTNLAGQPAHRALAASLQDRLQELSPPLLHWNPPEPGQLHHMKRMVETHEFKDS